MTAYARMKTCFLDKKTLKELINKFRYACAYSDLGLATGCIFLHTSCNVRS